MNKSWNPFHQSLWLVFFIASCQQEKEKVEFCAMKNAIARLDRPTSEHVDSGNVAGISALIWKDQKFISMHLGFANVKKPNPNGSEP